MKRILLKTIKLCSIQKEWSQTDYFMNKEKNYMQEADNYTQKAEKNDRNVSYYNETRKKMWKSDDNNCHHNLRKMRKDDQGEKETSGTSKLRWILL